MVALSASVIRLGIAGPQAAHHQLHRQPVAEVVGDRLDHGCKAVAPRAHGVGDVEQVLCARRPRGRFSSVMAAAFRAFIPICKSERAAKPAGHWHRPCSFTASHDCGRPQRARSKVAGHGQGRRGQIWQAAVRFARRAPFGRRYRAARVMPRPLYRQSSVRSTPLRLAGLDLLRLLAALAVVVFHFGYAGPTRGTMATAFPEIASYRQIRLHRRRSVLRDLRLRDRGVGRGPDVGAIRRRPVRCGSTPRMSFCMTATALVLAALAAPEAEPIADAVARQPDHVRAGARPAVHGRRLLVDRDRDRVLRLGRR